MNVLLDLFSGIGGFAKGLTDAGFKFDKHYFSEIDKHATANYKNNFKNGEHIGAIQDVSGRNIERPNIITFGFPCQDLSIAGKRRGLAGKRSGLYFEAMRIIEDTKPDIFIFENVKGLLSSNEGKDFEIVLRTIADLNLYDCEGQLLNTSWFLPQNRERIYFIGHLRGKSRPKVFPIGQTTENNGTNEMIFLGGVLGEKNKKWLDDEKNNSRNFPQGQRIYSTEGISAQLNSQGGGWGAKTGLYEVKINVIGNVGNGHEAQNVYDKNGLAPSVREMHGKVTKTLLDTGIRRLTPKECERLQGFPDDWTKFGNYDGNEKIISDSQRYKLLGNAVSVPVVKAIGERLLIPMALKKPIAILEK